MIDISAVFSNFNGAGPLDFTGKDATGAGAIDGTEFIAAMIDNWMWGWTQALFTQEGFSPNGSTETNGNSQIVDAIGNMIPPGIVVEWNINTDPATYGARYLLLNGQGILRSSYPALDANVYVGDGDNATADAYYRADDAAGTIRNTTGDYLILPESRGYTVRGLDAAASVDPDGATRSLGDNQLDAFQVHAHQIANQTATGFEDSVAGKSVTGSDRLFAGGSSSGGNTLDLEVGDPKISVGGISPKVAGAETRMANRSTQFAIKY